MTKDSPVGPDSSGKYKVYVKDPSNVQQIKFRVRAYYKGNYAYTTPVSTIVVSPKEISMNFPPFIESKSESWVIELNETDLTSNLRYTFPNLTDAENNKILISPTKA